MEKLAPVVIDPEGTFKYIQIVVHEKHDPTNAQTFVRGSHEQQYHQQLFEHFVNTEVTP